MGAAPHGTPHPHTRAPALPAPAPGSGSGSGPSRRTVGLFLHRIQNIEKPTQSPRESYNIQYRGRERDTRSIQVKSVNNAPRALWARAASRNAIDARYMHARTRTVHQTKTYMSLPPGDRARLRKSGRN